MMEIFKLTLATIFFLLGLLLFFKSFFSLNKSIREASLESTEMIGSGAILIIIAAKISNFI